MMEILTNIGLLILAVLFAWAIYKSMVFHDQDRGRE